MQKERNTRGGYVEPHEESENENGKGKTKRGWEDDMIRKPQPRLRSSRLVNK